MVEAAGKMGDFKVLVRITAAVETMSPLKVKEIFKYYFLLQPSSNHGRAWQRNLLPLVPQRLFRRNAAERTLGQKRGRPSNRTENTISDSAPLLTKSYDLI